MPKLCMEMYGEVIQLLTKVSPKVSKANLTVRFSSTLKMFQRFDLRFWSQLVVVAPNQSSRDSVSNQNATAGFSQRYPQHVILATIGLQEGFPHNNCSEGFDQ